MNRVFRLVILLFTTLCLTSSCERDDLCPSDIPATPRLIIVFKDQANPLLDKTVNSIQVREEGQSVFAPLNSTGATTLTNIETISVPLKFASTGTQYELIRTDENGVEEIDLISFTYDTEEEFVNRACGFRILYKNLVSTLRADPPLNRWIQSVITIQTDVTSNTSAHVEIRH